MTTERRPEARSGVLAHLRAFVRRLRAGRRTPIPVDLDLHQQIVLRTLARFGPVDFARLAAEVTAVRLATPAEIANAVLRLETVAVIARQTEHDRRPAERRYVLTQRGRRIARLIPAECRSALLVYV